MGEVIGESLESLTYEDRLATLLRHRVGLWDVVGEAIRPGSLDTAIREAVHNDLGTLVEGLPDLRAVAFNGGAAAKAGARLLNGVAGRIALVPLPSSSPALTQPFTDKAAAWSVLRETIS
jgi:hypoxanthine-DNA glycosylase